MKPSPRAWRGCRTAQPYILATTTCSTTWVSRWIANLATPLPRGWQPCGREPLRSPHWAKAVQRVLQTAEPADHAGLRERADIRKFPRRAGVFRAIAGTAQQVVGSICMVTQPKARHYVAGSPLAPWRWFCGRSGWCCAAAHAIAWAAIRPSALSVAAVIDAAPARQPFGSGGSYRVDAHRHLRAPGIDQHGLRAADQHAQ